MTDHECDDRCDELDFSPADPFASVLKAEYAEIRARRAADPEGIYPADDAERPRAMAGLSLSGGGIRSATFSLGLLQALESHGLLKRFDFFSTVSGGGYCGGWWSAWLSRDSRKPGEVFPPPERIEPERHEIRHQDELRAHAADAAHDHQQMTDSALNAGTDPIHHLRLFSNFLTPRKGLLSGDTWRAIATIGRNLVLTWLVLIPLILAAIMVGQAYFALLTENQFEYRIDLDDDIDTAASSAEATNEHVEATLEQAQATEANEGTRVRVPTGERLLHRFFIAMIPPLFLLSGVVFCVIVWMLATRKCWKLRDIIIVVVTFLGFAILSLIALFVTDSFPPDPRIWQVLGAVALFYLIVLIVHGVRRARMHQARITDGDFWRNHLSGFQTQLLQWSVLSAAILLFAGFGHEIIDFLIYDTKFHTWAGAEVARAGGWGTVILTIIGSIYTATKASPSGGDDRKDAKPGIIDRFVFALIPPLMLFVLAVFLAWIGHRWYAEVYEDLHDEIWYITVATVISAFLFLAMAMYEFRPRSPLRMLALVGTWLAVGVGVQFIPHEMLDRYLIPVGVGSTVFVLGALWVRGPIGRRNWGAIAACAAVGVIVGVIVSVRRMGVEYDPLPIARLPQLLVMGMFFTISLLLFELAWGAGSNTRSFALMIIGFGMFVLVAIGSVSEAETAWRALAIFGCIATVMGWVLALGWLADPNVLTIHAFYKARIVRAFLGASNDARAKAREADVTEAVPGDDVALKNLKNTRQGAPYHLINTCLNLVGASDLATVQRFSDSFTMSKLYCGSMRTGYRPTDGYSCGTVTLGTAVAVSGAAASPSMGGQTPSAALSMLLTLFNVRLGYWAPTPNRSYWRAGSARLWPVYTIQELMSQTTDLSAFCYLTDGGHFDNTGVYTLIQRGCRYILFADCGADPRPGFADLGDLIRKARIDFGTEIDIDIEPLLASPPSSHFIVGTIRYSEIHAKSVGLAEDERVGTLIVIKPNRAPGASVDVQQYGFANQDFPQQTTADQWYDEQQFESYRRLGRLSGEALFGRDEAVTDPAKFFDSKAAD